MKKKYQAKVTLTWEVKRNEVVYDWNEKNISSEIITWLEDLGFKVKVEIIK